ncbi:MAG: hypothetical protein WCP74_12785 [Sphingobacteriia bacterium]|jgi:hypothetical protein
MSEEKKLSEKESLELISSMIQKVKNSYHDTGIGSLLWGTVVFIASFVSFLKFRYGFDIGFDIWLIVLGAIIPQVYLSIKESKSSNAKRYDDDAIDTVWLVYGLTIFGLSFYQSTVGDTTNKIIQEEGWTMMKHYLTGNKVDEQIKPFTLSVYSLYILIYAFPTLVTGLVKKFKPMIIGAIITYVLFMVSCFVESQYDFLLGGIAALLCWFIPGVILRRKYIAQKKRNV